ncbi:hypothetical protein RclHR1_01790001 [Rhizophagus clarus]|uniref:SEL1 protein n=1 Tax=Rhizophagus clarus TaxID=94130 RepID=A0A2Z6QZN7_9GLOM|nr:hypothetical protein RclHR1_01790001 [Rhizophagus clarus]
MTLSQITNYNDDNHKNFLKEFLKEFYRQIIKIENYKNFDDILMNWMKDFYYNYNIYYNINNLNYNDILKLMERHKEHENWFSGLIGFFYEYGIIIVKRNNNENNDDNKINKIFIDKKKSLKLYLSSINKFINDENKDLISIYQLLNIIISKYLLSLYYYKDIIINKGDLNSRKGFNRSRNVISPYNQLESFNGLIINLCKDEINSMEKFFGSTNKRSNDYDNKEKELIKLNNLGYCYQYGIGKNKDEFKAFEFYLKSAVGGNLSAQNNLGYCYQNGIGITKNEKKAFEWYLKAANEGDLHAQYNLGNCYQNGIGIFKDDKVAFGWYLKSAKEDYSPAQFILGNYYENEKNLEKSIYWYNKAADNGNKFAQYKLGNYYLYGIGVERNETKAFKYYEKSAEKGYVNAQNNLGFLYIKNEGTEKDLEKAIYWFHKAAANEDEVAYDNLAICYELGIGVNKDENKAFVLYEKSAEKGYINSKFHLGYCYINGIGTKINNEKGFELYEEAEKGNNNKTDLPDKEIVDDLSNVKYWYQRLVEIDNKEALYELGEIYESGKGVNQNEIRAFDFYRQAAEKGCINGEYKLAHYFLQGIIVDIDIERALNLYKKAAEMGNVEAQKILELLSDQDEEIK